LVRTVLTIGLVFWTSAAAAQLEPGSSLTVRGRFYADFKGGGPTVWAKGIQFSLRELTGQSDGYLAKYATQLDRHYVTILVDDSSKWVTKQKAKGGHLHVQVTPAKITPGGEDSGEFISGTFVGRFKKGPDSFLRFSGGKMIWRAEFNKQSDTDLDKMARQNLDKPATIVAFVERDDEEVMSADSLYVREINIVEKRTRRVSGGN
jgi:hypothetical protein